MAHPAGAVGEPQTSARRLGAPDAKNRTVLLDAAEKLMRDEGYAAVSSRRVADQAGLKPQLVHYYFRTMDDLFLELFRRRAEEMRHYHQLALQAPQPLWALWELNTDAQGTAMTMARYDVPFDEFSPTVLMVLMTGATQVLVQEQLLGVTAGHEETLQFAARWLTYLEGARIDVDWRHPDPE